MHTGRCGNGRGREGLRMDGCGTPVAHLLLRIRLAVTFVQGPLCCVQPKALADGSERAAGQEATPPCVTTPLHRTGPASAGAHWLSK